MATTSKLGCWNAVLKKVSEWGGNLHALNQEVFLQDQSTEPKSKQQKTLGYLFERIIYYILFHHEPKVMTNNYGEPLRQKDLPEVFEIYDSDSK
ncbi:hypothetical protein A0O36_01684 [Piscirickettsiaceae bacterium NZ-RLO1]|nr:hypothetical protein A0O36_01684 [Piscirickettsiaceae bacterium NZ-RLO1]